MSYGDVARAVAGIDAVGVAGEALGRVDFEAPDGEAVAVVVRDVEVGRIPQRDAVQGEPGGAGKRDQARAVLMGVGALGILGQVPPGLRLAGQPRPSAGARRSAASDRSTRQPCQRRESPPPEWLPARPPE